MTGQSVVRGRVVIFHVVINGPGQRHFVHDGCHPGQFVTDANAGRGCLDDVEVTANPGRSVGFRIKCVEVTGTAELVEEDH